MAQLLDRLQGGDRRSIGRVAEVVAEVLSNPDRFGELIAGMQHPDPVVRMRAADAAEKVSADHPDYLSRYKDELLHQIAQSTQQEVRWHVAQMLPRLALSADEQTVAVAQRDCPDLCTGCAGNLCAARCHLASRGRAAARSGTVG